MARSRQQINGILPGTIVVLFITTVVFTALISLWIFAFWYGDQNVLLDSYLWRVLSFTFIQALLSTIISIFLAVIFAKSLYESQYTGKSLLIRLLSVTFVLPSLVVVTGLLAVYGHQGWLAQLCQYLNIDYQFSIYGFSGILIAHVFLNFPFAGRLCYQVLMLIPNEQRQLSQQLNLTYWQTFKYLEFPVLFRLLLPLAGLIFMLCFSSFATVLALGGGPKYTTIEVAIYQAIRDFELYQAVILSLIQLVFCLSFMMLLKKMTPKRTALLLHSHQSYLPERTKGQKIVAFVIVFLGTLFIISPLVTILFDGIRYFSFSFLTSSLLTSLLTSITVAFCSAIFALGLAIALLWTNSRLQLAGKKTTSELLMLFGSLILAVPSMVLSAGFFILFYRMTDVPGIVFLLVMISNSFLALPFILKNLEHPVADLTKQYHLLCLSLDIRGFNYFQLIEFKALNKLFAYSFAFACIMSMGDFGIVALFGSQDFTTLPYYLYELVSYYRYEEAAFTASLLLLMSFLFIMLFEYGNYDRT